MSDVFELMASFKEKRKVNIAACQRPSGRPVHVGDRKVVAFFVGESRRFGLRRHGKVEYFVCSRKCKRETAASNFDFLAGRETSP